MLDVKQEIKLEPKEVKSITRKELDKLIFELKKEFNDCPSYEYDWLDLIRDDLKELFDLRDGKKDSAMVRRIKYTLKDEVNEEKVSRQDLDKLQKGLDSIVKSWGFDPDKMKRQYNDIEKDIAINEFNQEHTDVSYGIPTGDNARQFVNRVMDVFFEKYPEYLNNKSALEWMYDDFGKRYGHKYERMYLRKILNKIT